MSEEVEIIGLAELQSKLEELPRRLQQRGIRSALRVGAEVIRTAMARLAPRFSGTENYPPVGFLSEHFGTKLSVRSDAAAGSAFIGPQGRIDFPLRNGGYSYEKRSKSGKLKVGIGKIAVATVARFLEFGTSKMGRHPFMTQAFESEKQGALSKMIENLKDTLGL